MENQNQPQPIPSGQLEIKIADNFAGGEYANAMQVAHTKDEVLLTFFNIVSPSGRVVSKIITNPGHLKRMIAALNDNLKKYEDKFGVVEAAESPKKEIGFQG